MIIEIWKEIPFKKRYSVSNFGRVRNNITNRILKPSLNQGYVIVNLYPNKQRFSIHFLVLSVFKPIKKKLIINHKDGNKLNNKLSNLEWCTHSYNMFHAYKNNLIKPKKHENNGRAILNRFDVKEIRKLYKTNLLSQQFISKMFNCSQSLISKIVENKLWNEI